MTRKDYELIAATIKATQERVKATQDFNTIELSEQLRGVRRTATHLADALASANPAFDQYRFLAACGYSATR